MSLPNVDVARKAVGLEKAIGAMAKSHCQGNICTSASGARDPCFRHAPPLCYYWERNGKGVIRKLLISSSLTALIH